MKRSKSAAFVADIEQQFEGYVLNASWTVADRYLSAVELNCGLLARHLNSGQPWSSLIRGCEIGDFS